MAVVIALLLQDEFVRAREKLFEGVEQSKVGLVRTTAEAVAREGGDKAARALIAALSRSRERLRLVDKSLVDARRAHEKALDMPVFTAADKEARAKAVNDAKARIAGMTEQLAAAEEIHDLLRRPFATLRSDAAVAAVAEELERSGSWIVRCEMAEALGAMEPAEGEKRLTARLGRETEEVVVAALVDALGTRGEVAPETARTIASKLASRCWQVQTVAARALASLSAKPAVGAMVEAMQRSEGRLRFELNEALRALTKTDFHGDPKAWQDWWIENKADFEAGTYDPSKPRRRPGPGRTTFFQVPVDSRRVCFVIDRSGSMKEGTPAKIDTVKQELKALLAGLPDGTRVNLIFFSDAIEAFSSSTRALDARTRKEAGDFIDRQRPAGPTNLHDALDRALGLVGSSESGAYRDDGVDTIYVLSDGEPTEGKIADGELLVRHVTRRNRFLRGVIHAIAVGDAEKVLSKLAEANGGTSVLKEDK